MPPLNRSQAVICTLGGTLPGLGYQNRMVLCHAKIEGAGPGAVDIRRLSRDPPLPCQRRFSGRRSRSTGNVA